MTGRLAVFRRGEGCSPTATARRRGRSGPGRNRPGIIARLLAGLGIASLMTGGGWFAIEAASAAESVVSDVGFSWRVNEESGGGAYFGGCNFLAAGTAGDAGSSRLWAETDGLYSTSDGNVTITKPDSAGNQVEPTWSTKCLDSAGGPVTTQPGSSSGNQVNLAGGSGRLDVDADTGSISWKGSFTIVYYGGMTYWTISDPVLSVENGVGTLTGIASGYGADMNDPSKWVELEPTEIELATFSGVDLTATGVTIDPDYAGIAIDSDPGGPSGPQNREKEGWGSFPQSFIDFNVQTGQAAYWYTSGGAADPKKPGAPIAIDYAVADGPAASVDHGRVPEGFDGGVAVSFSGLGDAPGRVELRSRADGSVLQLLDKAVVDGGTASGRWDVSTLARGPHEFDAVLVDGSGETVIELASPVTIVVVAPLADAAPELDAPLVTARSIAASWGWPAGSAAGPPSSYVVQAFAGPAATGTPVAERTVPADPAASGGTTTLTGLAPSTQYTVAVTPQLAGENGSAATRTVTTKAAGDNAGGNDGDGNDGGGNGGDGGVEGNDPGGDDTAGATFYWGLNQESNAGAFFGGCNFLVAGRAGDKGAATPWTDGDGMYASAAGNVTIIKPVGQSFEQASWSTKCTDRTGAPVSVQRQGSYTESQVRITGGEVATEADGSVQVQWRGSFTVAFYGGMTYWSATDPLLVVDANGNGKVTATASGYGASMHDASKWVALEERTITLANLTGLTADAVERDGGFTMTPDYLGVAYTGTNEGQGVPGSGMESATEQAARNAANGSYWGSFPADFVDFQGETGQFSYWFTSNGQRDPYKPTTPMTVSLDGAGGPVAGNYNAAPAPNLNQQVPGGGGAGAGGNGGGGAGADALADAGPADGAQSQPAQAGPAPLTVASGDRGPISPALLVGSGLGLTATGLASWAVGLLIRRRLGLDPAAFS
ncbi:hypothetical protein GCM10011490_28150 [Pseudoclavibacter endophyticus]|uniref:Fibronectin type-III domain-containing protein n=1 Tax=Pseudoclavibacter endophyticus TaxID=1778590 RepID=A0A6H9WJ71_9MICO|nr:hypothetical protein [Pseudoclavibacter endophyticus]KAB1646766.1 hypothetical protein F8O04_13570 [Pseudoclavibacter endophyticus]GGA75728.1 hypothetical protein GCM10011490_28150 [Pseudoclavibacter endophyticus]